MKVRTLYVPVRKNGRVVHLATVRSDWAKSDWEELRNMFPDCSIKTARWDGLPLWSLALNPPSFSQLSRWKIAI